MTWATRVSFALALILAVAVGSAEANPLNVPPLYAALRAQCGDPAQRCCSLGPACDASGSECMSSGVCSVPLVGENGRCITDKNQQATPEAGFCGPGLRCELPAEGTQGTCIPCGGLGETCCAAYSLFCDAGLSCASSKNICLPAAVAEGQRCDFKTPCQSGLTCSNPAGGVCERCGGEFAACCASGTCNAGPLLCSAGKMCLSLPTVATVSCGNGILAPSADQCPFTRLDQIRVLNYNVQLWPQDTNIDLFMDFVLGHWPQTDRRAHQIGVALGQALTSRAGGFDIIALQEAWDPERRAIIVEALEQEASSRNIPPNPLFRNGTAVYDVTFGSEQDRLSPYHRVGNAIGGIALGTGICSTILGPIGGLICGVIGLEGGGDALAKGLLSDDGDVINSGLMLMSRFPIVATDLLVYEAQSGEDEFARKGAVHALVFRGKTPNDFIHVFATHLQNGGSALPKQIEELRTFIAAKTAGDPFPILVLGDFNVDGNTYADSSKNDPVFRDVLLPRLTGSSIQPQLQDTWLVLKPNQIGETSDGGKRLDYIFASKPDANGGLTARSIEILPFPTSSSIGQQHKRVGFPTLSDHLGVSAVFSWPNPAPNSFVSILDPKATRIDVSVGVRRLFAVTSDSCNGKMDFFGKVNMIGGSEISRQQVFDRDPTEGNDIRVTSMAATSRYPVGTKTVRATIEVRDDDDFFCGGSDDAVDINPFASQFPSGPSNTILEISIDLETGAVHVVRPDGSLVNPPITSVGGIGRTLGNGNDETAEVTFSVKASSAL